MLYVVRPQIATQSATRLLVIVATVILTALAAQVKIPYQPVPITFQVFMVLLSALVLGPRDAAAAMLVYLAAIGSGLPIDANNLGAAALAGPTAGYLYSFPLAAALSGLLAVRDAMPVRWLAGMVGVGLIYLMGSAWLKLELGLTWQAAYEAGVEPFILIDILKAAFAATLAEAGRQALLRWRWF